ncbi:MAG: YggS family pyridoxal phosphate-dependent enzyme [Kordiimonadaceae bacterium]|nr:YggS family pyridoxal phosphate-dependent enzyme [Kordiimonadaceae bacterium]
MTADLKSTITANLLQIDTEIKKMCKHVGREKSKARLIAASKVQPKENVVAALEAGHKVFGENRVQEAQERWSDLKQNYEGIELHLIGGLQTNKAAEAVALFDVIQSVDRPKLARFLAREMKAQNRHLPLYLQINTGAEEQKGGCMVADLPALLDVCAELELEVQGLMCIPPADDDPSLHFSLLKKLAKHHKLERLSMGMSSDYALAASMGATDIRVGTAVFGARE